MNPCRWKAIGVRSEAVCSSTPLFFPSKWNAHFQLTHAIPETYPIGTQRPTHIQPCDPSAGLQEWDVVSAFLSLTPQWEALAKTRQSPGTVCQLSGSIQSIHCIGGHFHVLFQKMWIKDTTCNISAGLDLCCIFLLRCVIKIFPNVSNPFQTQVYTG